MVWARVLVEVAARGQQGLELGFEFGFGFGLGLACGGGLSLQRVLCVRVGRLAARDGAPNAVGVVNCVVARRLADSLGGEVLGGLAIDPVVSAPVAAAAARADVMVAAAMPVRGILHARRVRRGVLPGRRGAWAISRVARVIYVVLRMA